MKIKIPKAVLVVIGIVSGPFAGRGGGNSERVSEEAIRELASRSSYPGAKLPFEIPNELWETVGREIREAVVYFAASGSNGKARSLANAIGVILSSHNIKEHVWANEVWMRSGYKNCLGYNDRKLTY